MTYDQYWYGDTQMVRAFREADRLKQKRADTEAWMLGAYVRHAIESSICNAFREKGVQPVKYPEEPFSLRDERLKKEQKEADEIAYAEAYMAQLVWVGRNWGKNGGSESNPD